MKVLRVRPKHYPEVIDIDCSLESLQKEVEGPIQAVYPWDDEVALICNEELFAYTVRGEGEDEEEATISLLAYENHCNKSAIYVTLEMR